MIGFLIWSAGSLLFIIMGIICFISKTEKPFGFFSNAEMFKVNNVKAYNRALGKLWIIFGLVMEVLGLPILDGQNSPIIIFSIIGMMFLSIISMAIYITIIEAKYKVK